VNPQPPQKRTYGKEEKGGHELESAAIPGHRTFPLSI
jgi:hypothetical protein